VNDVRYLGLINKEADAISKVGTRLTLQQREYFKAVVRAALTSRLPPLQRGRPLRGFCACSRRSSASRAPS
jgi:hypothetical protein